jgi:hypothetical protein
VNELQKEQIKKVVYTFASLSNINDKQLCDNLINHLININIDDAMDYIIVSLNDLVSRGNLKQEDVFSNVSLLTSINSETYSSTEDLLKRLHWLKSMNMEHPQMPLTENHKLVLDTFDKFNEIIGTNFDCYYTGGLMGYLATNHQLERYHGDLDLFINEEQLLELYNLIQQSTDFEFISNMDHKEENGHEFKIQCKGKPMSIGLFLFEKKQDGEIIIKEYYHSNNNPNEDLLVNEQHLTPEYAQMIFSEQLREHNGIPYKMQSLESIYNAKKNSRPKDRYDAGIIKNNIDMIIDYNLDTQKQDNYDIRRKNANDSIVAEMERKINNLKVTRHI